SPLSPLLSHSHTSSHPPLPPLFPYTTLFRSATCESAGCAVTRSARAAGEAEGAGAGCAWFIAEIVASSWARRRASSSLASSALRSEEHTSELQSLTNLVCRLLLEKKKTQQLI